MWRLSIVIALLAMAATFSAPAKAGLSVCNDSGQRIYVAVAWYENDIWYSRGWTVLGPNECRTPVGAQQARDAYYYYAATQNDELVWDGKGSAQNGFFCTSGPAFFYHDANNSKCQGATFKRVNLGADGNGTKSLYESTESPRQAAQQCSSEIVHGSDAFAKCWTRKIATDKQRRILDCYDKSETNASFALCANSDKLDPKIYKVADCAARYHSDENQSTYAKCLGSAVLTPEQQKIASCVIQSNGDYVKMGTCALGPNLTPEQSAFVNCAATTGPHPYAFAACVGTALTTNELNKCLNVGIGGSDGCFGNNNTAVKLVQDAWHDITKGPGPTNDLVGRDGFVPKKIEEIKHDLTQGPGSTNDLVGCDGAVAKFFRVGCPSSGGPPATDTGPVTQDDLMHLRPGGTGGGGGGGG